MSYARFAQAALFTLAAASFAAAASQPRENRAMTEPSASRPAPPEVPGVDHKGVHYEQDMQSSTLGGLLAAYDTRTGARLWTLKVYEVKDHSAAGVQGQPVYFRSMAVVAGRDELAIENEVGARYTVDLANRSVTTILEPTAKPKAPAKKLPTPPG
jgi:hypothetical protein